MEERTYTAIALNKEYLYLDGEVIQGGSTAEDFVTNGRTFADLSFVLLSVTESVDAYTTV
jgi:hypothetical protein